MNSELKRHNTCFSLFYVHIKYVLPNRHDCKSKTKTWSCIKVKMIFGKSCHPLRAFLCANNGDEYQSTKWNLIRMPLPTNFCTNTTFSIMPKVSCIQIWKKTMSTTFCIIFCVWQIGTCMIPSLSFSTSFVIWTQLIHQR